MEQSYCTPEQEAERSRIERIVRLESLGQADLAGAARAAERGRGNALSASGAIRCIQHHNVAGSQRDNCWDSDVDSGVREPSHDANDEIWPGVKNIRIGNPEYHQRHHLGLR